MLPYLQISFEFLKNIDLRNPKLLQYIPDAITLCLISIPLSLLLYFLLSSRKHKTLVDLGDHKWLVK